MSVIPMSVSATAVYDLNIDIKATTAAPTLDGNVSAAEYGGNEPIVLDGQGKYGEDGEWGDSDWSIGIVISYYFTWDTDNLYWAVVVDGDETRLQYDMEPNDLAESRTGGGNTPWRDCDLYQIMLNPDQRLTKQYPMQFTGSFEETPQMAAEGYRSSVKGEQNADFAFEKAFSGIGKADFGGHSYVTEVAMPWTNIFVKGIDKNGSVLNKGDFTDLKAEAGLKLGLCLAYVDEVAYTLDGGGTSTDWSVDHLYRINAEGTHWQDTSVWTAEKMCGLTLNLKEAGAPAGMKGDFTGDGAVNNKDATVLLRYIAKWPSVTGVTAANGDLTGDGAVNNKDATILLRYIAKWPGITLG